MGGKESFRVEIAFLRRCNNGSHGPFPQVKRVQNDCRDSQLFMKNEAKKGRNNMLLRSTTLRYQWLRLSHFETGVNRDPLLDFKHGAMPVRSLP
jgi:hypothetical protein